MVEKSKKVASGTAPKKTVSEARGTVRSKKSFPLWILVASGLVLVGAYFLFNSRNGSDSSTSTGSFTKVEGEVDSSNLDQWSYANGFAIGSDIKASTDQLDEANKVDATVVAQGVSDALLGVEAKLTEEQIQQIYTERQQELLEGNISAGEEFIEEYKQGEDVVVEENGVAYKVLTEGDGEAVGENIALVTYVGKKIDGTEFDSSERNGGQPVPFTSAAVIPGLGSVLEKMNAGAKYEIVIPSELAYGEQGSQGVIEPNETLVFEIEVTEIQEAPAQAAPALEEDAIVVDDVEEGVVSQEAEAEVEETDE